MLGYLLDAHRASHRQACYARHPKVRGGSPSHQWLGRVPKGSSLGPPPSENEDDYHRGADGKDAVGVDGGTPETYE